MNAGMNMAKGTKNHQIDTSTNTFRKVKI